MKNSNKNQEQPLRETCVGGSFFFTPENLLSNLDKLGPWSTYGLAVEALQYYFPDSYDENGYCDSMEEVKLLDKLECQYWSDAVVKYQNEVGYVRPNGFNPDAVNEF